MDGDIAHSSFLSGSSSINAQLYIRGHRRDYDEWRDLGNPGWGFDQKEPRWGMMSADSP